MLPGVTTLGAPLTRALGAKTARAWGGDENGQLGIGSLAAGGLEKLPVSVGIDLTEVSSTASNVAGLSLARPRG